MSGVKVSGKVKWFNNAKGYGFINEDGKSEDLFAHYSAIQMDGYKTLKAGQAVVFEIIQGPKGLHAVNIGAPQAVEEVASPAEQQTVTA
ncbi:cold shock domain-containing protein CspD [Pseudomonas sp. TNT3]|uniref:cold shock domain-containing protein CspD n=1 Tax=Pseudomonas sp. TNT3 TaxID=2654097 RepID=UPI001390B86F|nr:cold shock domain-containing protein CspD [Pseudomonas sp. TNT3]KAI2676443.1 cold shock domain-containing protein CspD [Pseudomonas sp. TNT3]MBH1969418.1 cold shock domain-containing protein CspD [Pseudomonadales bacterium]MBH2074673.1 cold shock domain-containing protein CspD [Pseudomonadales bacterium]